MHLIILAVVFILIVIMMKLVIVMSVSSEGFTELTTCDSIKATPLTSESAYAAPISTYTGEYGQSVMIVLPQGDVNLRVLDDGTLGFGKQTFYFIMEFAGGNPGFAIENRKPKVVYLTDYFFIKTHDGMYVTILKNQYNYTLTNNVSLATTFYLFQKHSNNYSNGGKTAPERNMNDDGLRFLVVKDGDDHNGLQWDRAKPNFNRFVNNAQGWPARQYNLRGS